MHLEDKLILACTCRETSEAEKARIGDMLSGSVDWQYLFQAALNHGVFPLVFNNLYTNFPEKLPAPILNKFRENYQTIVARNLYMTKKLLDIVDCFSGEGISAVPFKGPLLAESLYGDIGLRVFGDLDILVSKHDALNAIQILTGIGYIPALKLSSSQMAVYMKYEDDLLFIHNKSGLTVEIHWEMSGRYLSRPMDMDFVNDGLSTLGLMNKEITHLSSEDLLVYLCLHGAKHMWERLEWIFSIAELVRVNRGLQWDLILKKSDELHCRRIVLHSLCLAEEIFHVGLPDTITRLVSMDAMLPKLNTQIKNLIFPLIKENQAPRIGSRINLFQLQLRDSMFEKFTYVLRELFEPKEADWHWLPLPSNLSFLYIILRPVRQLLKVIDTRLKLNPGKE